MQRGGEGESGKGIRSEQDARLLGYNREEDGDAERAAEESATRDETRGEERRAAV